MSFSKKKDKAMEFLLTGGCDGCTTILFNIQKPKNKKFFLSNIDISSFTTNIESVSLLSNLPNSGKIIVKREFYNKISGQIPTNWEKVFK